MEKFLNNVGHTQEKELTAEPHQRKALSFFLIYPVLRREADLHNQVIHCQTLESISCLFTNLLVIWYRDKVPNQLVSNKNLLSFSLWRRITQVAHLSHGTKATNTQLFSTFFPQLFLSICSYTDGGLSSPEQWLIRFVFPFNINTLSLRAKKLLPLTALLTERE